MNKILRTVALSMVLAMAGLNSHAQFYVTGDEPAGVRWRQIETSTYRIIYPEGMDSLSREYARRLESYAGYIGTSAGYRPGCMYKRRTPVVLHPFESYSNGVVSWAPRRMELFTLPAAYDAEPLPWMDNLAIHESRHVSQMQFGNSNAMRPFNWVFGEMATGAFSGVFPGKDLLEGDAVIMETALSSSGRGRTADFLNYYMMCSDNGHERSWLRWRCGSVRYHTPDHYALGYLYYSGLRYFYDSPYVGKMILERSSRRPYSPFNILKVSKQITGAGRQEAFPVIMDSTYALWKENKMLRAPFICSDTIVGIPRLHTEYHGLCMDGEGMYSQKKSMSGVNSLVMIDSLGNERRRGIFNSYSSPLRNSPDGRIYWSESISDLRWGMRNFSVIGYMERGSSKKHILGPRNRYLYNPYPSEDGKVVCAVEFFPEGGTGVTELSAEDGSVIASCAAPDSLQLVQAVWLGDAVYATAVTEGGFGIYSWNGGWERVLDPQPVKISGLFSYGGHLSFTCDRTGVNELYDFYPCERELYQRTSTEYGASDFQYGDDCIVYSRESMAGKILCRTPLDSLVCRKVEMSDRYIYPVAEKLSSQERELGFDRRAAEEDTVEISEPRRYSKVANAFRLHSWAPAYFQVDNIMAMSYDYFYEMLGIGAAAVTQNTLGNVITNFGYNFHKDSYDAGEWRHSGHLKLTCTAFYPVIEYKLDVNDRNARQYMLSEFTDFSGKYLRSVSMSSRELQAPLFSSDLKVYVPLQFNSHGWGRGLIPQVDWIMSNDCYNTYGAVMVPCTSLTSQVYQLSGMTEGRTLLSNSLYFSLRGYCSQSTAEAAVYPRFGIGVETGVSFKPGLGKLFAPLYYAYLYGYLPGIARHQGMKLTFMAQTRMDESSYFNLGVINTLPRGMTEIAGLRQALLNYAGPDMKFTVDYAIPVYMGDFAVGKGLMYFNRLVLTPHFDFSLMAGGNLWSAGATVAFDMGSLFWIKAPFQVGVVLDYNGGNLQDKILPADVKMESFHVAPVFSVSF